VTEVDDVYLVRQARLGYVDAYEELVSRHTGRVYRTALRMLGRHEDAQDVTQDTFVTAWQRLSQFKAESSYATWLYRIVTNKCLNRITRTKAVTPLAAVAEVAETKIGPAEQTERSASAEAVTAAVAALPDVQRIPLVLHQFEGLSYAQIADITESTVPSVRSHLHRARRTLAETLQEWR
jgi:RNA polymerase sigma-70 factor (ECF subfamily)